MDCNRSDKCVHHFATRQCIQVKCSPDPGFLVLGFQDTIWNRPVACEKNRMCKNKFSSFQRTISFPYTFHKATSGANSHHLCHRNLIGPKTGRSLFLQGVRGLRPSDSLDVPETAGRGLQSVIPNQSLGKAWGTIAALPPCGVPGSRLGAQGLRKSKEPGGGAEYQAVGAGRFSTDSSDNESPRAK